MQHPLTLTFLALPGDAQLPLADLNVDVLALDAGQLCLDFEGPGGLVHVGQ
jgi:hypothetical protein